MTSAEHSSMSSGLFMGINIFRKKGRITSDQIWLKKFNK